MQIQSRARRVLLATAAAAVVVIVLAGCTYADAATPTPTPTTAGEKSDDPYGTGAGVQGQGPNHGSGTEGGTDQGGGGDTGGGTDPAPDPAPVDTTDPPPLEVLARDCSESTLAPHDGFQLAPRCVNTSFGEVASQDQSPSLLITDAPRRVRAGKSFTLTVSTRNLVRDRFLGAAAGGYYLESSLLDEQGLQRGHFHTACRMLTSTDAAPDAAPAPAFFLATQDNQGGAAPDSVTIPVTGLPRGIAQCAVWAGDGSHRVPMMQRANQTPAFDVVRITIR